MSKCYECDGTGLEPNCHEEEMVHCMCDVCGGTGLKKVKKVYVITGCSLQECEMKDKFYSTKEKAEEEIKRILSLKINKGWVVKYSIKEHEVI